MSRISSSNSSHRAPIDRERTSGGYLCNHQIPAILQTCTRGNNRGKRFYGCPLWQVNNCHYFHWSDNDALRENNLQNLPQISPESSYSTEIYPLDRGMEETRFHATRLEDENRSLKLKVEALQEKNLVLERKLAIAGAELDSFKSIKKSNFVISYGNTLFFGIVMAVVFILGGLVKKIM